MKLNKTLMIAALIAGSVFAADIAVRAQDATNTPPAGARPPGAPGAGGRNLDNLATQLGLNDDQKAKAKPVLQEMQQKMRDLHQDTSLTPLDRRAKTKEIRDAANTKLKEIFTPEQFEKWQKLGQGGSRRPGGGKPPAAGNKPPQ